MALNRKIRFFIRKFNKKLETIDDLLRRGSLTVNMARFLEAAVKAKLNIIISGGTGTGKTTLLNILSGFLGDDERIITIEDAAELKQNTYEIAAAWLACGLDTTKTFFYRQSDIAETCELTWYLSCFFPYQRLTLAHSFKDKADRLDDVNAGLFTYPVLMAADILLYDAEIVPVGKDQLQHLEMARDMGARFNHQMGEVFVLPQAELQEDTKYVPGTDGQKMSKSRGNIINIFLPAKE